MMSHEMMNDAGFDGSYDLRYLLLAVARGLLTVEMPPLMADSVMRKILGSIISLSCIPVYLSAASHVYPANVQQ